MPKPKLDFYPVLTAFQYREAATCRKAGKQVRSIRAAQMTNHGAPDGAPPDIRASGVFRLARESGILGRDGRIRQIGTGEFKHFATRYLAELNLRESRVSEYLGQRRGLLRLWVPPQP